MKKIKTTSYSVSNHSTYNPTKTSFKGSPYVVSRRMGLYKVLSLIFGILSTASSSLAAPSLLGGTIQYSKNSTLVATKVIYSGTEVIISAHETATPKVTFEIPKGSDQWHFDILITPATIGYQLKQLPDNLTMRKLLLIFPGRDKIPATIR